MTKVQIVVELTIDDFEDNLDIILSEMNYNFSHVKMKEGIGKQLYQTNLIKKTEILEIIN